MMSKVYCQNDLCPYWRKSRKFQNYGICKNTEVFMTSQSDDEFEVTGHNCECRDSKQNREYIYKDGE